MTGHEKTHLFLLILFIVLLIIVFLFVITLFVILLFAVIFNIRYCLFFPLHTSFRQLLHHLQKLLPVVLEEIICNSKNIACT